MTKTAMHAQVIVVGLGSLGSMTLWQLADRGVDVLGIEQFSRIHQVGAYAGESRLFRVAAKEGVGFTPALLESRRMWEELGRTYGADLLLPVGALSVAPAEHPSMQATLASIREYSLPHRIFGTAELRSQYPQFAVDDDAIGVVDQLGGAMRPEMAVAAATDRAFALGARAAYDTTVRDIVPGASGVAVVTDHGTYTAERVVVTAGPWVREVLPEVADVVSRAAFALTWLMPRHVERFTPDKLPGFMRDRGDVHAFGVPTLDGYSIKICPHLDLGTDVDGPVALSAEQLAWVAQEASAMMPDLIPDVVRSSVHYDSFTANKLPVIEDLRNGVIVATAMSGNGFKFAPVWGRELARMAIGDGTRYVSDAFTLAVHRAEAALVA